MTAKLLVIGARDGLRHIARESLVDVLQPGDLVVANDAATLPASLHGTHLPSGSSPPKCEGGPIEVRLAGRSTLSSEVADFNAIVFGAGDFRERTEDRPPPPQLAINDTLVLGPLTATITGLLGHPRLISLRFHGTPDQIWAGLAHHGKPIQYAHVQMPLVLWDVWTAIASPPVAFEPPSAGFALDWRTLAVMRERRIGFATITHAAGISSTGDPELDKQLPFDEPYNIPESTAQMIAATRANGGRIIAIGTTVVRALEHAARPRRHEDRTTTTRRHDDTTARRHVDTAEGGTVQAGPGVANQRIGPGTRIRVVDAVLTGVHERGTSHYNLLRAFADDITLSAADEAMAVHGYRPHEFGDSVLVIPADPVSRPAEM